MAIRAYELFDSRSFQVGKETVEGRLKFVCHGTGDDADAKAAILAEAPATYPGIAELVRGDVDIRTIGGLLWYAEIPYIPDSSPLYPAVGGVGPPEGEIPAAPGINTPLGADFSFDLSAQTEHITQSKETISKTKRGGGVAPDTKRAIGVTSDGDVKGCDRLKPYLEFSVTRTFESITMDYIRMLSELVGTNNNAVFYGYPADTLIFMGASGNTKDTRKCVVTFKFAYQKNETDIVITEGLTVPSKKGWHYLWVAYKNVEDANKLIQQPDSAYVERIYDRMNYAIMGIG